MKASARCCLCRGLPIPPDGVPFDLCLFCASQVLEPVPPLELALDLDRFEVLRFRLRLIASSPAGFVDPLEEAWRQESRP